MDFLEEIESERIYKCVYVGSYYHKVCFVGPKDNARTIFLFVALLSQLHFFLLLKTYYKKKGASFKSTFGVPVCFRILQSAVMRRKTTKKGDFFSASEEDSNSSSRCTSL